MLFRKALITMAVLGATSTAALARPIISADVNVGASWSAGVDVRDHRYDTVPTYDTDYDRYDSRPAFDFRQYRFARRFQHRPHFENRLAMLSEINRIDERNGNRAFVNLNGTRASTLTIQASGAMSITQIAIDYFSASGVIQTMVIHPNVVLDRFGSTFTFDLGANVPVNRIVVYGRNMSYQSGFSVLGR